MRSDDVVFCIASAAVIAVQLGCTRENPEALSAQHPGAPVILISIDTLRADRLPIYGYRNGSTPVLDRLARDGIVFDDVYSHAPLTLPSHASLLTGLLPTRHGVRDNIGYTLEPRRAARSRRASKPPATRPAPRCPRTCCVIRPASPTASISIDDAIEVAGAGESLADTQRDGRLTVDALAAWLDRQGDSKVFAFLHLYEPHTPYSPPPAYRTGDPYDGEIAYADELVGRLLDRIKTRGWLDRAIVAIVSDHGEGLGDHGESEHGILLYREALQVPWILRLPGGAGAGRHVAGTLGLVDVAATLLDLAGLDAGALDGQTVRPALATKARVDRRVYSETFYPRLHLGWSDLASATEQHFRYHPGAPSRAVRSLERPG